MKYSGIKDLIVGSLFTSLAACATPNSYNDSLDRFLSTKPAQDYHEQKVAGSLHQRLGYGETPILIKGNSGISDAYRQQRLKTVNLEDVVLPEAPKSVTIERPSTSFLDDLKNAAEMTEDAKITDYAGTEFFGEGINLTVEHGYGTVSLDE